MCDTHNNDRRKFLIQTLALSAVPLLPGLAHGMQISNLQGNVWVNGRKANSSTRIIPGDTIETGPAAKIIFVVNQDAYLLREHSRLTLQARRGLVRTLRLLTGGLLAAFGKGEKTISTPYATAGIRGTGTYVETNDQETYFCTCYGEVELKAQGDSAENELIVSNTGHSARFIRPASAQLERLIEVAPFKNHNNAELEMLESLVGRKIPDHLMV